MQHVRELAQELARLDSTTRAGQLAHSAVESSVEEVAAGQAFLTGETEFTSIPDVARFAHRALKMMPRGRTDLCTFDANGNHTVTHNLGWTPSGVVILGHSSSTETRAFVLTAVAASFGLTTFEIRCRTIPAAGGASTAFVSNMNVSWLAFR